MSSVRYATGSSYVGSSGTSSISSRTSLSSLRQSLPENPHIYDFSEISAATNNFLAKRYSTSSSSTACWRCTLRGKDVIVFQRKFLRRLESEQLQQRLSVICRSHHRSIIRMLGASISGEHLYLVYDFVNGANLANVLRNQRNPDFTVLSTWISRMQIATDLANGLDYIHNNTGLSISFVHNRIKSNSVVITEPIKTKHRSAEEPLHNAKICHFGTAQLCGETDENQLRQHKAYKYESEIVEEESFSSRSPELKRTDSRAMLFEGVRGYMSPEFQSTGVATQQSDVYAFGVVILELMSGEEPLKYRMDKTAGEFRRTSVIDTARAAMEYSDGKEGRLRRWMDRRLKDSFPVEIAEKVIHLALDCVHVDPDKRPDMSRVSGKISKLFIQSTHWWNMSKPPTEISVSLAPR